MKRLLVALLVFMFCALPAQAAPAPSLNSAKAQLKALKANEARFARTVGRLSASSREKLKSGPGSLGKDSDHDGISDTYEKARGSSVCDGDSDNDGVGDDDDPYERDGEKKGEVEVKGKVVSFNDPTLVIGTTTFTVTSQTVFRRPLNSKEDLTTNLCVEVNGYIDASSNNIATRIKKDNDCAGDSGEGGEGPDDN